MTIQIAIIGLGQIGASIGLALREQKATMSRVGNDIEISVARQAEKLGAVDKLEVNLPTLARSADLVILALPVDQVRNTLELIASDLREGCVVMDTSPAKQAVMQWAGELLPEGRFYVGLTPVINPAYLYETAAGLEAAHADLFKDGLMGIVAPPDTDPGALKMAADLTKLLGAGPMFADPLEMDGVMAAVHLLPQLLAAVMVHATVEQPGWPEARKLAGQPYQQATQALLRSEKASHLRSMALYNRENALRVVTDALLSLETLRSAIEEGDEATLDQWLGKLRSERERWERGRRSKEWQKEGLSDIDLPTAGSFVGRLFGFGGRKPNRNLKERKTDGE